MNNKQEFGELATLNYPFDTLTTSVQHLYFEAKEDLAKNVLHQMGYDLEEVLSTKGQCIAHKIHWEKVGFGLEQCEYLCVNGVRIGEVRLFSETWNIRCEVRCMENKIIQFRGDYNWLSNFQYFDKPMIYGDLKFLTNEHFYIAMKTLDQSIRKEVSEYPAKGLKKFGRTLPIREDWEEIKIVVMLYGLRYKFSHHNPSLRNKLLNTTGLVIEEGNWWGDRFWGICLKTGKGENHLGKLLMKVREDIRDEY